jgi:predicted Ser/Thr protein kinase/tetratricopeptide (TPR) repeat protein
MEKIGRYELIRELGHGAMGRVFVARDPTLERSVALKLLASGSEGARQRFHDEAKALAALNHPGIVTIYEVSEHDGQDFIAMEYLAGRTLRERLAGAPRDELVAIAAKVALAVDAAHRAGILHRDIKPENIIVTDGGDVKVVDFGIARRLHAGPRPTPRRFATVEEQVDALVEAFATTRVITPGDSPISAGTHTVFGTPAYMAPEILTGGMSSEASDVYSLGVTLYECLAGRRPYERASLVELMATVIEGSETPPRIADAHADLVERMLARDPAARPKLAEVAAALAAKRAPVRARRWPLVVGACVIVGGAGLGVGWRATRTASTPAAAAAPQVIGVERITLDMTDVAAGADLAIANAIATVGASFEGAKFVGPDDMFAVLKLARPAPGQVARALSATQLASAERELGVTRVARGTIEVRAGRARAHVEISGGAPIVIEREAAAADLPKLELDLAEAVVRAANPDARLALGANTRLARLLAARAEQSINDAAFYDAGVYLEQAVLADPKLFGAWNTLALAREWMFAPEETVKEAIDRARSLAPDDTSRQLLTGISQYLDRDFRAALATLAPLEGKLGSLDDRQKHDLFYYLGETHWHAGRQSAGVEYFRRVLDVDPRFSPAAIHPAEYALARRDGPTARALSYLQGNHRDDSVEFSIGHYEQLAAHGPPDWMRAASIVLGRPPTSEIHDNPIAVGADELARAIESGDAAAMRHAIDGVWQFVDAQGPSMQPSYFYSLQIFGEVLICGELTDDTRKLVTYLAGASTSRPVGGYPRLVLLAAPLLHDKSLIVHTYFTDRLSTLADASDAELAGDRARAATLLRQLVSDPSPFWDYPERAALVRNLRALGRGKEAEAVCADTMRPAVFRYAFMPMRTLCQKQKPARRR